MVPAKLGRNAGAGPGGYLARLFPAAESERWTDRGQADLLRRKALFGAVATLLNAHGLGGFRVLAQRRAE